MTTNTREPNRRRLCPTRRATLGYSLIAVGLTLVAGTSARGNPYSDQIIADGAIHYWRFEETSVDQPAKDEIPDGGGQKNNPGVYEGGIELGQESAHPLLGKAARFDEQNGTHVLLGDPQHPGNSITVEAWVWLDGDHTVGFSPIIARWDGSYELDVNHQGQGGELDFVIRNDFNAFIDPHSDGPMTTDEWHHVVGIFHGESDGGGGTGIVYLDGERQIDVEAGGDLQDAGGDDGFWYIGRTRNPNSNFTWKGLIDEVAVYPVALTEEQIKRHIEIATTPVVNGDFDGDGDLDARDIDLLSAEVRKGMHPAQFDLTGDGKVTGDDHRHWVTQSKKTWFGDANMDGLFNTGDLVTVFQIGEYEDTLVGNSGWGDGDWNGDAEFNTGDLVTAFQDGGFEAGMRAAVSAVPEPATAVVLFTVVGLGLTWFRPGRQRDLVPIVVAR